MPSSRPASRAVANYTKRALAAARCMCRSSVLGSTAAHPAPSRHLQTGGRGGASTTGVLTSFQKSSRSPTTRNAAAPPASGRLGSAAELPRSFITLVRWPSPRSSRRLFFFVPATRRSVSSPAAKVRFQETPCVVSSTERINLLERRGACNDRGIVSEAQRAVGFVSAEPHA